MTVDPIEVSLAEAWAAWSDEQEARSAVAVAQHDGLAVLAQLNAAMKGD